MAIIIWNDFVGRFTNVSDWETFEGECSAFAKEAVAVAAQVHATEAIISEAKAVTDHSKLSVWRALLIERRRYNNYDLMRVVFYERVARAAEELAAQDTAEDEEVTDLADYSIISGAETSETESNHVNVKNDVHSYEEYVVVENTSEDDGETADDWSVISASV